MNSDYPLYLNILSYRSDVLKQNIPRIEGRPGEEMAPLDFKDLEAKLKKTHGSHLNECDVMSAALYPKVASDYFKFRAKYGPVVRQLFEISLHSWSLVHYTLKKSRNISSKKYS